MADSITLGIVDIIIFGDMVDMVDIMVMDMAMVDLDMVDLDMEDIIVLTIDIMAIMAIDIIAIDIIPHTEDVMQQIPVEVTEALLAEELVEQLLPIEELLQQTEELLQTVQI